jgi:hypothetical protein
LTDRVPIWISARVWDYKVVPFASGTLNVPREQAPAHAAKQFGDMLRMHAIDGWEYYRTDPVVYVERGGCLPALFGAATTAVITYNCAVFRRARG